MRFAMSGSTLSSARKDMVTIGAATPESYPRPDDPIRRVCIQKDVIRPKYRAFVYKRRSAGSWRWRAEEVIRRDRALAEDVRFRPGEVEHRGRRAAGCTPAVYDGGQAAQLGSLIGRHRGLLAVEVGAGGHERTRRSQQLERHLVLRDAHAHRAAARGVEDDRQRAGPPPPDELLSACVDVDPAVQLGLRGRHEDQRHAHGATLDDEYPLLSDLVGGAGAQAVDGIGRKSDHTPAPQQPGRAREALPVGLQDHDSRTRAWPARSRCTRWLANETAAACSATSRIAGSISSSARPLGRSLAGADCSRRVTRAAPRSGAYSAVAGWARTSAGRWASPH